MQLGGVELLMTTVVLPGSEQTSKPAACLRFLPIGKLKRMRCSSGFSVQGSDLAHVIARVPAIAWPARRGRHG